MINNYKVSSLVKSTIFIIVSSTIPAFSIIVIWLISMNIDAIYTNLWTKIFYLITVLVGIWFLNKINFEIVRIKVRDYKRESSEIVGFIILSIVIFGLLYQESMIRLIALIVTYTIVGISEELLYRGYMLTSFKNAGFSFWTANIIQAILFAMLGHYSLSLIDNLIFRLPFAIVFGMLSVKLKSIIFLGELHATYDLIMWFYF